MEEQTKKVILIIDDEAETRNLVVNYLESNEEYIFYTANNGRTGIEIAVSEHPSLILLDWQMPEVNGLEVLEALKSDERTRDIPVMMYTGIMTDANSLRTALQLGAHDFLRKPMEPIEIEARIRSVIGQIEQQKQNIEKERRIYQLEKRQLEIELEARTREAVNYAKFMAGKNEIFSAFADKLKGFILKENLTEYQARTIHGYINELRNNLNVLRGYEQFAELFNQLHPSFKKSIQSLNVSLTENEKQMLSFIKLNLSNKEIATLLSVSLAAVEKGKYRLKQKLQLDQEVNLQDFVATL